MVGVLGPNPSVDTKNGSQAVAFFLAQINTAFIKDTASYRVESRVLNIL